MNSTDIVAYIGAAAWLPPIFVLIYSKCSKPNVTIVPDKFVEIGYTTFGPLFNLRLSINVDKKDILLDHMSIILRHEDGSTHNLEWSGIYEIISEVKNNHGDSQVIHRDGIPIQIKLNTLSLFEKLVRFREVDFLRDDKRARDNLGEYCSYLQENIKDKNKSKFCSEYLNSKVFTDYLKHMRKNFWWKAGTYFVSFKIKSPSKISFNSVNFQFQLSQTDIDFLGKNLDKIKDDHEFLLKNNNIPEYKGQPVVWLWRYPELIKA